MNKINYSFDRLNVDQGERAHIRTAILRLKQEFAMQGLSVVELGSGTGANLAILQPENTVLGIEGLADAASHATNLGVNSIVANLENPLDLVAAQFDWAICLDVLEHLAAPEQALHEAHRVLKPGGKLLINVPNHFTLTGRMRMLFGEGIHWNRFFPQSDDWNNPHIRFFTHKSITQLLVNCGFKPVRDLSALAPAVPMGHQLRKLGFEWLVTLLAKRYSGLFCGGFFLLAERV